MNLFLRWSWEDDVSYIYFLQQIHWNIEERSSRVRSIVEIMTPSHNPYHATCVNYVPLKFDLIFSKKNHEFSVINRQAKRKREAYYLRNRIRLKSSENISKHDPARREIHLAPYRSVSNLGFLSRRRHREAGIKVAETCSDFREPSPATVGLLPLVNGSAIGLISSLFRFQSPPLSSPLLSSFRGELSPER